MNNVKVIFNHTLRRADLDKGTLELENRYTTRACILHEAHSCGMMSKAKPLIYVAAVGLLVSLVGQQRKLSRKRQT
jgi:hypothetical protein